MLVLVGPCHGIAYDLECSFLEPLLAGARDLLSKPKYLEVRGTYNWVATLLISQS